MAASFWATAVMTSWLRQHRGGESNSWVISMEIGEDVIEQGADHVACKCHVDTTRYFIWLIVNERVQAGYGVKQRDTFGVKTLPGRRHFEDSRAPFDQAAVEMPLDPTERIADGRLLQPQLFARRCDSFLLHDDHERPEQVPVHVPNKSMRPLPHAVRPFLFRMPSVHPIYLIIHVETCFLHSGGEKLRGRSGKSASIDVAPRKQPRSILTIMRRTWQYSTAP